MNQLILLSLMKKILKFLSRQISFVIISHPKITIILSYLQFLHKIEKELHSHLKSVLSFLNLLAERIPETELQKIPTNPKITKILGEIG